MGEFTESRTPVVAGQFYPGQPDQLNREISHFLDTDVKLRNPGRLQALVVPHAGYAFSGNTAGKAFSLCRNAPGIRRVAVLAPSHRVGLRGASVGNYSAFSTPLGNMEVDTAVCAELTAASSLINTDTQPHRFEHALEVQLPFIQHLLPEAQLIPLVCGDMDVTDIRRLANALTAYLLRPDTLIVVSSDFTHYGSSFGFMPFRNNVPERVRELDMGAIEQISSKDLDGFKAYISKTGATICGRIPIAVLLAMLEQTDSRFAVETVDYTSSGLITGDFDHTVSYAALAVLDTAETDTSGPARENEQRRQDTALSADDKQYMLRLAREVISAVVQGRDRPEPATEELSETLQQPGAVFVTLRKDGQLRGCIGNLQATEPLYRNVIDNAINAAFSDPRFSPLSGEELSRTTIEISYLTPARTVSGPDEIEVGRHGIILKKGPAQAVFLPQVASEQGWDLETTLDHLALKAGLPQKGWRQGAEFQVFEAVVFSEEE